MSKVEKWKTAIKFYFFSIISSLYQNFTLPLQQNNE